MKKSAFNWIFLIFVPVKMWAAACCGGGFALPSLITGDDKAQLTTSVSYSQVDTDVLSNGIWKKNRSGDTSQILKIEGAHIFADSFQAGFSVPVHMVSNSPDSGSTSSSGLGDVSTQVGYEYLPDWNYNPWRPRGVGFVTVTLPTGQSVYDSSEPGISRGRGFWVLGIGTVLTKTWTRWDANVSAELHHSFEKVVSNSEMLGNVVPGNGHSFSAGAGYNWGDFRVGGAIAWVNEDPINVEGTNPSQGDSQRFATGTLSGSFLFSDSWAGTFSYSDQTLFGEPTNSSLSKIASISLQRRWAR